MEKNIPDARNRILQAALKIFAEKSFEGSRIDEIAEKAGVPKSLIYYHFKNKKEILDVLFSDFIVEYRKMLAIAENDTHQSKAEAMPQRNGYYRDFFIRNADLVRIIFMDSLKKSDEKPFIFEVAETIVRADGGIIREGSGESYDADERLIAEFFTNIIPLFAFLCYYAPWSKIYNIDEAKLSETFSKIFAETHGAYHRNHP